jgi:hypothetical protein
LPYYSKNWVVFSIHRFRADFVVILQRCSFSMTTGSECESDFNVASELVSKTAASQQTNEEQRLWLLGLSWLLLLAKHEIFTGDFD